MPTFSRFNPLINIRDLGVEVVDIRMKLTDLTNLSQDLGNQFVFVRGSIRHEYAKNILAIVPEQSAKINLSTTLLVIELIYECLQIKVLRLRMTVLLDRKL